MGAVVSRVPELIKSRNWKVIDLIRRGMTYNMAYRVARGEVDISLEVATMLVDIFELNKLDEVFHYVREGGDQRTA